MPGLCESLNLDPMRLQAVQTLLEPRELEDARDSRLLLRGCNGLMLAADVCDSGTEYRMQVRAAAGLVPRNPFFQRSIWERN